MAQWNPNQQFQEVNDRIRKIFSTNTRLIIILIILLILSGWIFFTGLYTVAVDEVAIIQLFGKYNREEGPGLHFKWPDGIEKRTNIKVEKIYTAEFGFRTVKPGVQTEYEPEFKYQDESLMLTGDLNCAIIPWLVQFRIINPKDYLFKVRNVPETMRYLSEAVMREIVGDRSINEVITKRLEIADHVKIELQKALDESNTGLKVENVELKNTNVPGPVQPSFNEVNQAQQEKERMIYEAREEYNKVIPSARGEAEKIISESEGYALDRINKAKGDSSRFVSLHSAYAVSKDVTRRRLYLETINEILPKLGSKYVVDSDQKSVLPLLNLGEKGGAQ